MLSVAECKAYLKNSKYSDEEIENIRDFLYALSTRIIKKTVEENGHKKTTTSKSE
jgi:hypothetical protein